MDEAAAAAPWLTAFLAALPGPNAGFAELTASTDGTRLVLEGEAPDADTRRGSRLRARSAASRVVDQLEVAPPPRPRRPRRRRRRPTNRAAPAGRADRAGSAPATSPTALQRRLDQRLDGATIAFEPGSATLTDEGEAALERIVRPLQRATGVVVEVQGHTDSEGGAPGNLLLSQDRAEAVVAFLVERGVPIGLLAAKGYGETRPRATNDTEDGRARNRRIELVVREGAADVG
ncbi:MAG: OmpA family protein [Thermoleophilia bacterium]